MKILVIQMKMIGDVLTSSILFEALRKEFPKAELHYLIYKHTLPVVENNPYIDEFVLFNPDKDNKIKDFVLFLKQIRQKEYDIVVDVYSKINTALLNIFSGAEIRISYHKWYTKKAYTKTFEPKKSLKTNAGYAIENRLHLLNGISSAFPVEIKPKIYLTSEEKSSAEQLLKNSGISFHRPLIMCGILGSSASKTYPLPYMGQILDFIVEKTDSQLLLNYIPKQLNEAQKLLALCQPKTREHIYFEVFGNSLREFMAITSCCDALIGNEGGAVNMAKALDIPAFSIFSPQIKKENWSIYEDGKKNVSVHLRDFHPVKFKDLSKKEIQKKADTFYGLLEPNLIFAKLESFLKEVT
ncbi:glycosyltransferase family 9 protein [Christiangramia sediminis]|uniref:Glycosyltransferase family 9 protein n=1 Tax=Christiangramia sediminis TaxID=2881336 RepID=A0A9X1RXC5_9FLAO|nr:glycosyltransferase family 9 protein [Christiangramia sediminis]MCB7480844.1 glycosyltransferase family 9 protein [Christiangramia sediminis]